MPNHFHLLVKIKSEEEIINHFSATSTFPKFETLEKFEVAEIKLIIPPNFISKQFANLFSSYTQSFNKVYNRRGSLFIKNFKRKEVSDDTYLRNLILYIHSNPIHHGFTKSVDDWNWSSYDEFSTQRNNILLSIFGNKENYHFTHQSKQLAIEEYNKLEIDLT